MFFLPTFQRWGKVYKPIQDNQYWSAQPYRYRCCHCRRTFRHYPPGVDRAAQTQRLRKLVSLMWVLGAFGILLSHMSVWRDLQEQTGHLEQQLYWQPVRVLGLDDAYVQGWDKRKHPVLVAVDVGRGQPVAVGYIDEYDPRAVRCFLQPLVQHLGVSVIVTDDLSTYRQVAEKLGIEHQVCQPVLNGQFGIPCAALGRAYTARAKGNIAGRMAAGTANNQEPAD